MKEFSDFDLTMFNSYRLRAICNRAFFPETEKDVVALYMTYESLILLGSGHNIILSRDYYPDSFLIFNGNYNKVSVDNTSNVVEIEAGAFMTDVSQLALNNGLSGLEIFYDIPSSFGGAVVMNAGASGEEMKDLLIKVRYLDLSDKRIKELYNEDIAFEYRNSFFQRNTDKVILKGWIQLRSEEKRVIKEKMDTIKAQRWAKQPKDFPNAGSVFKRPKGYYVGAVIDELNLKGYTVGGAKISEKHGGFIINFDNAIGHDILEIIKNVRRLVWNKYNIDLEVEQRII